MKTLSLATLTLIALMAAPAYAQDPVPNAYGGAGNVVNQVAAPNAPGQGVAGVTESGKAPSQTPSGSGDVLGVTASKPAPASEPASEPAGAARPAQQPVSTLSSLPFTGSDALLLLMAGGMLFAVGFGMRRLAR